MDCFYCHSTGWAAGAVYQFEPIKVAVQGDMPDVELSEGTGGFAGQFRVANHFKKITGQCCVVQCYHGAPSF